MLSKQKKSMCIVSLLAACTLVTVTAIAQTKPAPAPPTQPVLVTNGAGQPVPTAAQGTTNVAGTVNIGNTPSVTVANTPSVNVANSPTVNLAASASVTVTNPLNGQNPVPLATLEAAQPYYDICTLALGGGTQGQCNFHTLPAGKRLVVQLFDGRGFLESGLRPIYVQLLNPSGGATEHDFPATLMGSSNGYDVFAMHQETHIYLAQSSQPPQCSVTASSTSNGLWDCIISGFLADVP
jgi:hypothetical protein